MHNCHDHNAARQNSEKNTEWEYSDKATTHIRFDYREEFWVKLNAIEGILNGGEKPLAEIFLLALVPGGSVVHLRFCFKMEAKRIHPSAAYALVKTSSTSRSSTLP